MNVTLEQQIVAANQATTAALESLPGTDAAEAMKALVREQQAALLELVKIYDAEALVDARRADRGKAKFKVGSGAAVHKGSSYRDGAACRPNGSTHNHFKCSVNEVVTCKKCLRDF